ncbi:hypothetical protein N9212_02235 [Luminiphilus sp.]|nr:hypothetical protein [Luminiphilus sp.]
MNKIIKSVALPLAMLPTLAFGQATATYTVLSNPVPGDGITGLAIDANGMAYATVTDRNLYEVDLTTGAFTLVGALSIVVRDLAIDTSGQLYGMCGNDNDLCTIDSSTGVASLVSSNTTDGAYPAISFIGSTLYYVRTGSAGGGTIDTATGQSTDIGVPSDGSTTYGSTGLGYDPASGLLIGHDCCDQGVGGQALVTFDPSDLTTTVIGFPTGTQQFHDFAVHNGVVYAVTGGAGQGLDDGGTFGSVALNLPQPPAPATPVPTLPLFGLLTLGGLLGLFGLRKLKR